VNGHRLYQLRRERPRIVHHVALADDLQQQILAQALLTAPDQTLSGDELQAALAHAFARDETDLGVSRVG
jgi:hypothetical protein